MIRVPTTRASAAPTARTWEVELLISGVAVFAMLQLPGWLDDGMFALSPRLNDDWQIVVKLSYFYAKSAAVVLAVTFALHLLLRAQWIALVGRLPSIRRASASSGCGWARSSVPSRKRYRTAHEPPAVVPTGARPWRSLAAVHGYTPVHLYYNSGQSIAANGRALSTLLEQLLADWPVPIERVAILGHSMGGLVARSAIASASRQQHAWVEHLDRIVFLGTPHHGAPLERAGHALQTVLGLTPWTAPFVRLGQLRSAGIQDLRHGWIDERGVSGKREPIRLPAHIRAHGVAASTQAIAGKRDHHRARGDGLVPVRSALGLHRDARLGLGIPPATSWWWSARATSACSAAKR